MCVYMVGLSIRRGAGGRGPAPSCSPVAGAPRSIVIAHGPRGPAAGEASGAGRARCGHNNNRLRRARAHLPVSPPSLLSRCPSVTHSLDADDAARPRPTDDDRTPRRRRRPLAHRTDRLRAMIAAALTHPPGLAVMMLAVAAVVQQVRVVGRPVLAVCHHHAQELLSVP